MHSVEPDHQPASFDVASSKSSRVRVYRADGASREITRAPLREVFVLEED